MWSPPGHGSSHRAVICANRIPVQACHCWSWLHGDCYHPAQRLALVRSNRKVVTPRTYFLVFITSLVFHWMGSLRQLCEQPQRWVGVGRCQMGGRWRAQWWHGLHWGMRGCRDGGGKEGLLSSTRTSLQCVPNPSPQRSFQVTIRPSYPSKMSSLL